MAESAAGSGRNGGCGGGGEGRDLQAGNVGRLNKAVRADGDDPGAVAAHPRREHAVEIHQLVRALTCLVNGADGEEPGAELGPFGDLGLGEELPRVDVVAEEGKVVSHQVVEASNTAGGGGHVRLRNHASHG